MLGGDVDLYLILEVSPVVMLQRERGSRKIRWVEAYCHGSLGAELWRANSVDLR